MAASQFPVPEFGKILINATTVSAQSVAASARQAAILH